MKDGCRWERGECLRFSAKLDRWLRLIVPPLFGIGEGLDVLLRPGGSKCEVVGSAILVEFVAGTVIKLKVRICSQVLKYCRYDFAEL